MFAAGRDSVHLEEAMAGEVSGIDLESVDLRALVGHGVAVPCTATVDEVRAEFARTGTNFIAVLDNSTLLGVCARQKVVQEMGSRFGFALYAHRPVREHLVPDILRISVGTPVTSVFQAVATRSDRDFYDDVLLVDGSGSYIGMIQVGTLVRLQTEFLMGTIARLEVSRREIAAKARQMEEDLQMASSVQQAMMPREETPSPDRAPALRIAHRFHPAGVVSGDFFDILRMPDGSAGILICDVMGHGVRSALIAAMIRAMLEQLRPLAPDSGAFLSRLNRDLTRILRQTGDMIFVTAAYCVLDPDRGLLRYTQAGHPTPLICRRPGGEACALACPGAAAGPALGLIDDFDFTTWEEAMVPGDRVLLFTDGVIEASSPGGEEFGLSRLAGSWSQHAPDPLSDAVSGLLGDVATFCGDSTFDDDICIVAAQWDGPGGSSGYV
jgi:sigma-B regulation protein RsbU (phosphoserine phosphatase)